MIACLVQIMTLLKFIVTRITARVRHRKFSWIFPEIFLGRSSRTVRRLTLRVFPPSTYCSPPIFCLLTDSVRVLE
jgi:hypothetical protein